MKIKQNIEKVPGGLMIVPLFLGTLLKTLSPDVNKFFGGFTGNFFNWNICYFIHIFFLHRNNY
ncbi:hypothetical protein DFR89_000146 [Clostridium beijerinckii]|nr:2-keto-3-deoxygluconate permease [Clostridium beijerinckii]NRZ40542.1 hypothetical protein [Clostridium beijerinckii]